MHPSQSAAVGTTKLLAQQSCNAYRKLCWCGKARREIPAQKAKKPSPFKAESKRPPSLFPFAPALEVSSLYWREWQPRALRARMDGRSQRFLLLRKGREQPFHTSLLLGNLARISHSTGGTHTAVLPRRGLRGSVVHSCTVQPRAGQRCWPKVKVSWGGWFESHP